jgi:SAM-dependent methyltransferase
MEQSALHGMRNVRLQGMRVKPFLEQAYGLLLWARVGLRMRLRRGSPSPPRLVPPENAVLQSRAESAAAVREMRRLGLPVHRDRPKNWDTLAALGAILRRMDRSARILDAGSATYSTILPTLWCYGYTRLTGINLEFVKPVRRGPARFLHGDVTATTFDEGAFDAITCLSVIEHGVDLTAFFKEAARLLRPGGILVTSTDFSCEPIDTAGRTAYGVPVQIFIPSEIAAALRTAQSFGLEPTGDLDLSCNERPVNWKRLGRPMGLHYTFVVFTLQKSLP